MITSYMWITILISLASLCLFLIWVIFSKLDNEKLKTYSPRASAANATMTTVAIIIAGAWAISTFVENRLSKKPVLEVTHAVEHSKIANGNSLLKVIVTVKNIGNGSFSPHENSEVLVNVHDLSPKKCDCPTKEGTFSFKKNANRCFKKINPGGDIVEKALPLEPNEYRNYFFHFQVSKERQYLSIYSKLKTKITSEETEAQPFWSFYQINNHVSKAGEWSQKNLTKSSS